jgi:hypothetical protein
MRKVSVPVALLVCVFFVSILPVVRSVKPLAPNGVQSMTEYESRIGETGLLLEDSNIQMWVPKRYEEHSQVVFKYLQDGYTFMMNLFGNHDMSVKFSIEQYPQGSPYIWGGTDAAGTIRYSCDNLIDNTPEWNLYKVPHVVGYYEEMAHCFIHDLGAPGFYEALGLMIGWETALHAASNPYIQQQVDDGYQTCATTTAYYLMHNTGEPGVPENIYLTRILVHVFKSQVIDAYGWEALSNTFRAAEGDGDYPLRGYVWEHAWGGFLGLLSDVTEADMHAIFGTYGLPTFNWTGEPRFEHSGCEPLAPNLYRFRIKIFDREGTPPSDVRVNLYYDGSPPYGMSLVNGNSTFGWIYQTEVQLSGVYHLEYAFSAVDGVHPIFQAIGKPTEKQQISIKKPTLLSIEAEEENAYLGKNVTLRGGLYEKETNHSVIDQAVSIESFDSGEWKNMGICSSLGNGTYVFVWQPTIAGTYVVRARYEGNTSYVESTSENITIQISISLKTDLNRDGTVNILDIFLVANAFGSTPADPNWKAVADLNGDGTVNILDIFAVAWDFGKKVSKPIELYYDDGTPEGGYAPTTALYWYAVCFQTPTSETYQLASVKYYIMNSPAAFQVDIRDRLLQPIYSEIVTPTSTGWFTIDLASKNILVQGNFWVAIKYLTLRSPVLGADTSNPDGQSAEGQSGIPASPNLSSLDWMIRAVVGPVDNG